MTETPATFLDQNILTTIPDLCIDHTKIDAEMNYLKKKNINETIFQKLSNKDEYELDMHKIYNLIVGQSN